MVLKYMTVILEITHVLCDDAIVSEKPLQSFVSGQKFCQISCLNLGQQSRVTGEMKHLHLSTTSLEISVFFSVTTYKETSLVVSLNCFNMLELAT